MAKETTFVTMDRWIRETGWLDPTDRQIIAEASGNGRYQVRFMKVEEMLEVMKKTEPLKFKEFHREYERRVGHRLTYDELVKYSSMANERMQEFTEVVETMNLGQAAQVRAWRCNSHMTWRSLARAAWREKWFERRWEPPENQLMGMALVEKAAQLFGENYTEPPWN
jgi:hypothetical protein